MACPFQSSKFYSSYNITCYKVKGVPIRIHEGTEWGKGLR